MSFFKACQQVVKPLTVTHLAAVNGCGNYLDKWLARSETIQLENKLLLSFKDPTANRHFVYGGNSGIQGNSELHIARLLRHFKQFEDDKVTLLAGLADLKKLLVLNTNNDVKEIIGLTHFERRRLEVANENAISPIHVSHNDVVESFKKEISPDGIAARYLKVSQLGLVIEDTLFTHGIINRHNMGYIPGAAENSTRIPCAREWIAASNAWYQNHINTILTRTYDATYSCKSIHDNLIMNPQSIVRGNKNLMHVDPEVISYLNRAGIFRVVIGHSSITPASDLIPVNKIPFTLVVGDTSFSDMEDSNEFRGKVIHNMDIIFENGRSTFRFDLVDEHGNRELFKIGPDTLLELTPEDSVLSIR